MAELLDDQCYLTSRKMAEQEKVRRIFYSNRTKLIISTCAIEKFEDEQDQKQWLKEMLGYLFGKANGKTSTTK